MEELRFPIGRFAPDPEPTDEKRRGWIDAIDAAPTALRAAVHGLRSEQLETPYRDGGWTVRQVAHHVPDSHLNAYTRFRLALTEDEPTIRTYEEARWATLVDARTAPVEASLALLDALHARWVMLLRSLGPAELRRAYLHPDDGRVTLEVALQVYAWHGQHHVAHIRGLRERMGWD